jgi:hypothetical protein
MILVQVLVRFAPDQTQITVPVTDIVALEFIEQDQSLYVINETSAI